MTRNGYFGALAARLRRPPLPAGGVGEDVPAKGGVRTTHVLSAFLDELRSRTAPVVIDLGPAIHANVNFLGAEVACKIVIEDLLAGAPSASGRAGDGEGDEPAWSPRLQHPDESVDGILCWDVLDHLLPPARKALAAQLVRVLRPGGVMSMCHRVARAAQPERVFYEIMGPSHLCLHPNGDAPGLLERPLTHRELRLMFGDLEALKTVLLKSRVREVLFRKAGPAAVAA